MRPTQWYDKDFNTTGKTQRQIQEARRWAEENDAAKKRSHALARLNFPLKSLWTSNHTQRMGWVKEVDEYMVTLEFKEGGSVSHTMDSFLKNFSPYHHGKTII